MTLAGALNLALDWRGTLQDLLTTDARPDVRLLEINEAGSLHSYLRLFPGHRLAKYPAIDMQRLAFADETFDLIVHSDTLEHVPDPTQGLRECWRVLRTGGVLVMTIPIVPSRLSRRCSPSTPSYHGTSAIDSDDWRVVTEYGADFFLEFLAAGWDNVSLYTLGTPASFAVVGVKHGLPWFGQLNRGRSYELNSRPSVSALSARIRHVARKAHIRWALGTDQLIRSRGLEAAKRVAKAFLLRRRA